MLRVLWAFVRRDLLVEASYPASFVFRAVGGAVALWSFYFLAQAMGPNPASLARYGGDYFRFALVGMAVGTVLRSALTQFSRVVREAQLAGSLEVLFAAPVRPGLMVLGSSLYTLLSALGGAVVWLVAGQVVFGADLHRANLGAALVSLVLGLLAFGSLGLISAAFVLLFKRGDPVAWALDAATVLLSGVLYPVEVLPPWMRLLSRLVPATHAIEALRQNLLFGQGVAETWHSLAALALCAALGSVGAVVALTLALRQVEKDGTLSHA